jgi:hypothetical protein
MEEAAAFAMKKVNVGGRMRPAYMDENGQVHEVKTSTDLDRWMGNNQLGKPKMVEWRNPMTGEKSWVPKRTRMVADPTSGEVLEAFPIEKESAKLVPLDPGSFEMPRETPSGIPIDPATGVAKVKDFKSVGVRHNGQPLIDPETMKPMTLGDMWGGPQIPDARPGQTDAVKKVLKVKV